MVFFVSENENERRDATKTDFHEEWAARDISGLFHYMGWQPSIWKVEFIAFLTYSKILN